MDEVFPIYVPSKGRPNGKTMQNLMDSDLNWKVIIEPQDAKVYQLVVAKERMIVLGQNDKGIAHVRNFILKNADTQNGWYWMLDDDISMFYEIANKRCVKTTVRKCLIGAQGCFVGLPNLAQAALEYQQFAWSSTKLLKYNSYCDVAVCINRDNLGGIKYRGIVNLKEDRDFTLQLLAAGKRTARVTRFAFAAPRNGSNEGGLYEVYRAGRELGACKTMVSLWGEDVCRHIVKPNGRNDVKINWKKFGEN